MYSSFQSDAMRRATEFSRPITSSYCSHILYWNSTAALISRITRNDEQAEIEVSFRIVITESQAILAPSKILMEGCTRTYLNVNFCLTIF